MTHPTMAESHPTQAKKSIDVWIGTSAAAPSKGIYHCMLNTDSGKLSNPTLAAEMRGPGFLAMHPRKTHIYAVGTLENVPSVVCYKIGDATLELVNSAPIGDGGAAHVAIDPTGRMILTAQYGGGSVACFSVNPDGSMGERKQLIKHLGGSKIEPGRQAKSHAHWVGFSPDNRFAFVPDLGLDQVVIYEIDLRAMQLKPNGFGAMPPGGGPRHMKFHTSGKWIYVLNELDVSVTVFDYDKNAGVMTAKQTIPAVPKEQLLKLQAKSSSEIRVHPNGRFVYSANRGHDTITGFAVHPETGELRVIGRDHIRGATPRNFNLDPSGKWLIAAGQQSHTLASFVVNGDTGELVYNRSNVFSPSPICVLFGHE